MGFKKMSRKQRIVPQSDTQEYQLWRVPHVMDSSHGQYGKGIKSNASLKEQSAAYKAAFELGLQEGKQKGYQEGMEQAEAEMNEKIVMLKALLSSLAAPLNELDQTVENDIVKLTLLIARHLIRREIKTEHGEIVAVVREALSILPGTLRHPTIYLHPEDIGIVKQALSLKNDERPQDDEQPHWNIKEDRLLERGDCRVESSPSYIDATMENRLSAIAAKMLSSERDGDDTA